MSLSDIVRRQKPQTDAARPAPAFAREARVSLLPPELRAAEQVRAIRRRLIGGVVVAAIVTAAGITGAAGLYAGAQVSLLLSNDRTAALNGDIAKYAAVSQLQGRVALTKTAVRVGSSTAIDWRGYLKQIDAVTPTTFDITDISINSASPMEAFAQGITSLDAARAGTVVLTAQSTSIDDLPAWLNGLATLPGYADASPNVAAGQTAGSYTVVVTMHITDAAYVTPITQGVGK